ncbi:cellulase family glycosylhydrolase [Actinoplanes sp. NPDC051470]|uniref:glycoside hydrolase family 5 protein n=1 Tax=Actinoplanes sp. NPDC051470 TaxID=3157224 RepID=UPI0034255D48
MNRRSPRLALAVAVVVTAAACGHAAPDPAPSPTAAPPSPAETLPSSSAAPSPLVTAMPSRGGAPAGGPATRIAVAGNQFVDGHGRPVRLRGFNHAGAEYSCVEGTGVFDTPDGAAPSVAVVKAMRGWRGAGAVRVPLNEQCWLGLPSVPAEYAGEPYRRAIRTFVTRLNAQGFTAVLDLHRSAPGDAVPHEQEQMPDRDHSIDFWRSVAATFTSGAVVFDLFNEPFPYAEPDTDRAWACWRAGGCTLTSTNSGEPYVAAGMSELVAAVRGTGSRTVVLAGGIYWAEGMTRWLRYRPADPLGQLAASFHAYSFNECADVRCYDRDLAPIAAAVPLFVGEIGPRLAVAPGADVDESCPASVMRPGGFATATFDWLDRHGASYTPWSWNPWGDCWSLVRGWDGEPTAVWGDQVRRRLAAG